MDLDDHNTPTTFALTQNHKHSTPSTTSSSTLIKDRRASVCLYTHVNTVSLHKASQEYRRKLWNVLQPKWHKNARLLWRGHLPPQLHGGIKGLAAQLTKDPIKEQVALDSREKRSKTKISFPTWKLAFKKQKNNSPSPSGACCQLRRSFCMRVLPTSLRKTDHLVANWEGVWLTLQLTNMELSPQRRDFIQSSSQGGKWVHGDAPASYFPGGAFCTGEISNPTEDKADILTRSPKDETPESI